MSGSYCFVWVCFGIFGYVWVCIGKYGYAKVYKLKIRKLYQVCQRGEEMGYFAFGGSTILVLLQEGTIKFDGDLLHNSSKPIESLVKMGMSMGMRSTF